MKPATSSNQKSIRESAYTAGQALLAIAILAPIAKFGIFDSLIDAENPLLTVENITNNTAIFLLGSVCLFVVAILDIVVAMALRRFFAGSKNKLVGRMAWLRIIYAAVFIIAISFMAAPALQLYAGSSPSSASVADNIDMFNTIWDIGLVIFAAHLALLGWLFFKVRYASTWLAPLLVVAGLGYAVDSFGRFFVENYSTEVSMVTFVGEALLILWLLIRGSKVTIKS